MSLVVTLIRKKNYSLPGPLYVWSLLFSVCLVFSSYCGFFPHPKHVQMTWTGMSALSQCERVCVSVCVLVSVYKWLCDGKSSCRGWILPGALSCWDKLQSPETLNWNECIGKAWSDLFQFISPKCMYRSHLFQCLVLGVFGSLFRSLVICLWPEIHLKNVRLVYINEPAAKLILL